MLAERIGCDGFAQPYIADGFLINKEVEGIPMNDECLLAWNKENMGNVVRWVLDWLGDENWLNRVWLQFDGSQPVGYHLP